MVRLPAVDGLERSTCFSIIYAYSFPVACWTPKSVHPLFFYPNVLIVTCSPARGLGRQVLPRNTVLLLHDIKMERVCCAGYISVREFRRNVLA